MGEIFRRCAFCRMNRPCGKAWSRTTNAYLNSHFRELWARFRRGILWVQSSRQECLVEDYEINAFLSSDRHELWASFRQCAFCRMNRPGEGLRMLIFT